MFSQIPFSGKFLSAARLTDDEIALLGEGMAPGPSLRSLINTDVQSEMHGLNAGAYLRIPLEIADATTVETLTLRMKYNDGFVAYLNGTQVASANAPAGVLAFDAVATASRSIEESQIWETFNLSAFTGALQSGTNILAIHGLNASASNENFLILPELTAIGSLGSQLRYFTEPTPGGPNGVGLIDRVADTRFSVDRGLFNDSQTDAFDVSITTSTPGAEIYFTTDGSEPSPENQSATLYENPIRIAGTTILRAAAFRDDYVPTNIDTQTYVFIDSVLQ